MNTNGNMNPNGNGFLARWRRLWQGRIPAPEQNLAPYRRLALQLHYDLPREDGCRSVLLATPNPSPVSVQGSVALACCLTEELLRPVLLIDACPKQPAVSHLLGCAGAPGLSDYLAAGPKMPLADLVLPTTYAYVAFLPAGTPTTLSKPAPPDEIAGLLRAIQQQYDFVLLCGGSLLNNSFALAVAPYVGCVLLLAVENETLVGDLDSAQDALAFCKARKVGIVFTTPAHSGR